MERYQCRLDLHPEANERRDGSSPILGTLLSSKVGTSYQKIPPLLKFLEGAVFDQANEAIEGGGLPRRNQSRQGARFTGSNIVCYKGGMFQRILSITCVALCALLNACQSLHPTVHTIPNFDAVNAQRKIYRGGEPLEIEGWAYLKSLGVRTVVKLNSESESTDAGAGAIHLAVVRLPITQHQQLTGSPDFGPTIAAAVRSMSHGAVFVHCGSDFRSTPNSFPRIFDYQGGQDRTSLVVGCYRVWVEHKKKAEARAEMKSFHFHALLLPGLARFWWNKVR
jgi:hypothetical protein